MNACIQYLAWEEVRAFLERRRAYLTFAVEPSGVLSLGGIDKLYPYILKSIMPHLKGL